MNSYIYNSVLVIQVSIDFISMGPTPQPGMVEAKLGVYRDSNKLMVCNTFPCILEIMRPI